MPTDLFRISGQWSTYPQDGGLLRSGAAPIGPTPMQEYVTLDAKNLEPSQLTVDTPVAVNFGGVTNCNVLIIQSDRPITVTVTSAAGTSQSFPCDGYLQLISRTVPITAVSLTRTPATLTNVSVFLGEKT